jgi:predicted dehydrogenase
MGRRKSETAPVRLGILGTRRGIAFAEAADHLPNVTVRAFCGHDTRRLEIIGRMYPKARMLTSYAEMLDDPQIDAVVVANYADEHVEAASQALGAGKHILSEVPACVTVAEGVALARAVESSGRVYMLGENFCYLALVQEMRRLYEAGELGEVRYAEGEYVHFARDVMHQLVDLDLPSHWRLWIPATFYVTHSIGPILRITGMRPLSVQAAAGTLGMNRPGQQPVESPAIEVVRLENGALVKSLHGGPYPREPWQPWYLIGGSQGCIESNRWPSPNEVTVYLDRERQIRRYTASDPDIGVAQNRTQHWGADLFVLYEFVKAIQHGTPPDIDVYRALDMTLCGILGWRSVLQGGQELEIPNLRLEDVRKRWENDHYSCKPGTPAPYLLPNRASTKTTVLPDAASLESVRRRQEEEPYYRAMYRD